MHRIQGTKQELESLWSNKTKGLSVINIPESVKQNLLANRGTMPHPTKKQVKKEKNSKIEIRDYQQAALQKVKENNWQGILEMATGTGKTITSLLIASDYKRINGRRSEERRVGKEKRSGWATSEREAEKDGGR